MFKRFINIPAGTIKQHFSCFCVFFLFFLLLTADVKPQTANTLSSSLNLKNSKNISLFYVREDGKIGVGVTAPEATFHVIGNDGMLFTGNINAGTILNPGPGVKMMWYPRKGAFRAGSVDGAQWDDKNVGLYSLATGYMTQARGDYSIALGINNTAGGQASIAMGRNSISNNFFSTAIGFYASALGESSFSLGYHTTAGGRYSFAFGYKASTGNHEGAFCIGDASSQAELLSHASNEMTMKFAGGYRLFSDKAANLGVVLSPEGNSWSSVADSGKRENFLAVNSEDVLRKISLLKPGTWNFKGNNKSRHYGISAQEFYHHFGRDSLGTVGNDSTISTGNIDGVTIIALQGLEKRTSSINSAIAQIDTLTSALSHIDTLASALMEKDSIITAMQNDIIQMKTIISEKEAETKKLNERLDALETALNEFLEANARKPE